MQHNGDLAAKDTSAEITNKLMMRNTVSENVALFVPTMHAQLSFNKLAGTDMVSHLNFLEALTKFHETLRLSFYTKVFDKKTANTVDWEQYGAKFYKFKSNINWGLLLIPNILFVLFIGIITFINLRQL